MYFIYHCIYYLILSQVVPFKFQQVYFVKFMVTQLFFDKLLQKPKYLLLHDLSESIAWHFEIIVILKFKIEQGIIFAKFCVRTK